MDATEFADAVNDLIKRARDKGLSDEEIMTELECIFYSIKEENA